MTTRPDTPTPDSTPTPPAATPSTRTSGSDPSLSVLTAIVDTALEPGYAKAATEPKAANRRSGLGIGAIVVLALAGLAVGIAVQDVRTTSVPEARQAREALAERVEVRLAATDALEDRLNSVRLEVDELTRALAGDVTTRAQDRSVQAAAIEVTGPGLTVTVDDAKDLAPGVAEEDDAQLGKVLDRDLQVVANGLWAAGAEAIAINGLRLTATSAIRSAGEAILVDYRPLSRPYVVEAIGPDSMRSAFVDGSGGLALRSLADSYGLRFVLADADELTLAAGSISPLRYAAPSNEEEASTL